MKFRIWANWLPTEFTATYLADLLEKALEMMEDARDVRIADTKSGDLVWANGEYYEG